MTERKDDPEINVKPLGVNPGYAAFQIAKALTTSREHADPATRERAKEKMARWETVLRNILSGSVDYGSRRPVEIVPEWATIEVVTGGFATGNLLAGGPLREHEQILVDELGAGLAGEARRHLNAHFLTDAGLADLQERLRTGAYDVSVPEEGALLVIAWLAEKGYTNEARDLLDQLSPYFNKLRFYPAPLEQPRRFGSRVHLQDVGQTINDLKRINPNKLVLAQKEAVEIWALWYDRMIALFLETVEHDWPCRKYPPGWQERATAHLSEYTELRKKHRLCGKPERAQGHFSQLRGFLGQCVTKPESLTGREVGRIRLILNRYVEKRGVPDSQQCTESRRRQIDDVSGPMFHEIAGVVVPRLEMHRKDDGLDEITHEQQPITEEESATFGVPEGTVVPPSIQRKVERCLNETVAVLVERDLITSGETLARVLPQITSGLRAAGISDPALRQLYAAIYRAFRRRRSLLLLNMEKQVQIEELPWVAAIDRFRNEGLSSRELARQTLEEVTLLTLTSFPYAILPNKLLQELRALAKGAELDVPLVEEVAVDIFMGEFSGKFLESAKRAAGLLNDSLYAIYYGIDYDAVRKIPETKERAKRTSFWQLTTPDGFVQVCASRAGVSLGTWDPATNGMIVEQQQIVTTQNLAALFESLDLTDSLRGQLGDMARECFKWICRRQQMKIDQWHARLIMLKNTAYGWRQMIFFLALMPVHEVTDFLRWAESHLEAQTEDFRKRFHPVLTGLRLATKGSSIDDDAAKRAGARRFLGWSKVKHWLLVEGEQR